MLDGIDDAIGDGVDVLSTSFGGGLANTAEVLVGGSLLGIGSFHAISHGIPFIASGGNSGPDSSTLTNVSPWIITVAATNDNTDIVTPIMLGNNKTILGEGLFKGDLQDFVPLVTFGNISSSKDVKFIAKEIQGKVLMLFFPNPQDIMTSLMILKSTGVLGFIFATHPMDGLEDCNRLMGISVPIVYVDLEQGNQILDYFQQCESNHIDPMIKFGRSEVVEGKNVTLQVPKFSGRGPNSFTPEILKPDVAAPGVNILAAVPPPKGDNGFQLMSGTSMSTPHVAGVVVLLKAKHPNWSPAASKSAIVTTAWNEDTYGPGIFSEGAGDKLADPFDYGGGICNPNGAMDPGLVYDMDKNDYFNYLCSLGYSNEKVYNATRITCPTKVHSRLDLNLPSISIPNLENSVTIKRTVTNVGDVNSIYKLVVKSPRNTAIEVSPNVLMFNSKTQKISFEVKITSTQQRKSKFNFGSLAWTDGKHFVRIPLAVRNK